MNSAFYRRKKCGFTLLEVLLGVMIFSVVGLSVYALFSSGIKLSRKSQGQGAILQQVRWALELIHQELENAVFYDFSGSYPDRQGFEGIEGRIKFVLPREGGLFIVEYYLSSLNESSVLKTVIGETYTKNVTVTSEHDVFQEEYFLMRKETPMINFLSGADDEGEEEIVCRHVKEGGLHFAFGHAKESLSEEWEWKDAWGLHYLPVFLRVTVDTLGIEDAPQGLTLTKNMIIPQGMVGFDHGTNEE